MWGPYPPACHEQVKDVLVKKTVSEISMVTLGFIIHFDVFQIQLVT